MSKCIYCKTQLYDGSVIDVCRSCGLQVWGEQMFNAIVQNMEDARDSGDLYQGSITQNFNERPESKKSHLSLVQEAITQLDEQSISQKNSQEVLEEETLLQKTHQLDDYDSR